MAYDISTKRGDTWMGAEFTISLNESPLDLTGATILAQVKKNFTDDEALLEFTTADESIQITDAAGGVFEIDSVVISLVAKSYVYDVQITLASGRVITPVSGTFEVTADVSR